MTADNSNTTAQNRVQHIMTQINPTSSTTSTTAQTNITTQYNDNDVLLVGLSRTAIGALNGKLSSLKAAELATYTIKDSIHKSGIEPYMIEEAIIGNVLSAGNGQAIARQACLNAGLPVTTVCTTINKVCASGMKSIVLAAQQIQLGLRDIMIAGGTESMSNAPFLLQRQLPKFGNSNLIDSMQYDGLFDPYSQSAMGVSAELTSQKYSITREQQDNYAIESFKRAQQATKDGVFKDEIVPITIKNKGKTITIDTDEGIIKVDIKRVSSLKPSFSVKPNVVPKFHDLPTHLTHESHNPFTHNPSSITGSVTAGNSSQISDGAAAVVLISRRKANELGILKNKKDIIILRSYADAETHPLSFPVSPSLAIPMALQRANIHKDQIDAYEINEAFSVVALANSKLLDIPLNKINLRGGGVSLGHPIGCSGARIIVTLSHILQHNNLRYGCAGICNGGGGGSAVVIERQVL